MKNDYVLRTPFFLVHPVDNTEPGVSELKAFALAPGLLEVILDNVTVLGLLLVRFLCKRF